MDEIISKKYKEESMRENQMIQLYENRGLNDFKLNNIDDILAVHGLNVLETVGFENLTEENKKLFKDFILNFFNAWGLVARSTLYPININYVMDIDYLGKENTNDDYYIVIGNKIEIINANKIITLLKDYKYDESYDLKCVEKEKKLYLRFEYEIYGSNEWQHVISANEWY